MNFVDLEKMLKNAYLDAKISFDTAENEPSKVRGFLIGVGGGGHVIMCFRWRREVFVRAWLERVLVSLMACEFIYFDFVGGRGSACRIALKEAGPMHGLISYSFVHPFKMNM